MIKAFELVRLGEKKTSRRSSRHVQCLLLRRTAARRHGPGVDRMVMLLAGESSIREIIPFPMNKNAQDVMMDAPSVVTQKQLDELHIRSLRSRKSKFKKPRTNRSIFHLFVRGFVFHIAFLELRWYSFHRPK